MAEYPWTESYCVCKVPYIGTQPLGEPTRCERCGNLVDTSDENEKVALRSLSERVDNLARKNSPDADFRPEIEEPEFSEDQTEAAEDNLERNRRVLALEIATSVGHLSKTREEFWVFVEDIVNYLK